MSSRICFIGLGIMGYPMAGHLARNGHQVSVYNRTFGKAQQWASEFGGQAFDNVVDAVADAEVVISCVGNDQDLHHIFIEQGGLAAIRAGGLVVDHTTASPDIARQLFEAAREQSLGFVDAPVSGGQLGAEKGQLTIMCGGDLNDFERVRSILVCYAKAVNRMGPSGSGQLTKMSNQIAVAGVLQGLAEAIYFAERSGLDCTRVIEVISKGAAQSWQMDNRGASMINGEFNFGFAVDLMRKDLGLLLSEARNQKISLPTTALIDQFYGDVQNLGGGRWDTSSLIQRLRQFTPDKAEEE